MTRARAPGPARRKGAAAGQRRPAPATSRRASGRPGAGDGGPPETERAYLIAVDTGDDGGWTAEESLSELAALVETAGAEVVGSVAQHRESVHPVWYLGTGKAEELKEAKSATQLHHAGGRRRALSQAAAHAGDAAGRQGARPQRA